MLQDEERRDRRGAVEFRQHGAESPQCIGYAAVFYNPGDPGTEYQLDVDIFERILPGAFDVALRQRHNARCYFNHDANFLLGTVAANTLRLSVDTIGLRYVCDLPDTQAGKDVAALLKRGDLSGSSFSFTRAVPKWSKEVRNGRTVLIRNIVSLELLDASPVADPAYTSTTATASGEIPARSSKSFGDVSDVDARLAEIEAMEMDDRMQEIQDDEAAEIDARVAQVVAEISR